MDINFYIIASTLLGIFSFYRDIILSILLLFIYKYMKVYKYDTNYDEQCCLKIYKYIESTYLYSSRHIIVNNQVKPTGYIISIKDFYFAYVESQFEAPDLQHQITYFGKKIFLVDDITLVSNKTVSVAEKNKIVKIYKQSNCDTYFYKFNIEIYITPYPYQQKILNKIEDEYRNRLEKEKTLTVLISGSSGIGKSSLCKLLALNINAALCLGYDMLGCGDDLYCLYTRNTTPTDTNPLILQIDEFDKIIDYVHNPDIVKRTNRYNYRYNIYDKSTYNTFMCETIHLMPYVIYIMTTNKPISYFEQLDPSYIANHRINLKITVESNNKLIYHN